MRIKTEPWWRAILRNVTFLREKQREILISPTGWDKDISQMRNTENGGITTLELVIDNIFVEFRGQ
jgi:hypothetical protein